MSLIWATRGWSWGFCFVRNDGGADPLPAYERVFHSSGDAPDFFHREDDAVGLRFPDPEGRRDRAGRPIFHDFVVFGPDADEIDSVETGRRLVWPLVAELYDNRWDKASPSTT